MEKRMHARGIIVYCMYCGGRGQWLSFEYTVVVYALTYCSFVRFYFTACTTVQQYMPVRANSLLLVFATRSMYHVTII